MTDVPRLQNLVHCDLRKHDFLSSFVLWRWRTPGYTRARLSFRVPGRETFSSKIQTVISKAYKRSHHYRHMHNTILGVSDTHQQISQEYKLKILYTQNQTYKNLITDISVKLELCNRPNWSFPERMIKYIFKMKNIFNLYSFTNVDLRTYFGQIARAYSRPGKAENRAAHTSVLSNNPRHTNGLQGQLALLSTSFPFANSRFHFEQQSVDVLKKATLLLEIKKRFN